MLLSIIITMVAVYFIYSGISFLISVPFASWQLAHWAIVLLVLVLGYFGWRNGRYAWQLWKKKAAVMNEQYEAAQEKQRAKRRAIYFETEDAESELAETPAEAEPSGGHTPAEAAENTAPQDDFPIENNAAEKRE